MNHQPVVVGIDGSAASQVAIRWAAAEAATLDAPLRLVHAVSPGAPPPAADLGTAVSVARDAVPELVVHADVEVGAPSSILVKASGDAQLIVIGSRGLGLIVGSMVGSTGLDLAANAHCPVVVVRPDLSPTGARVVIGYDGSPGSDNALYFGLAYARRHNLAVRVVAAQPAGTDLHHLTESELRDAVYKLHGHDTELVEITGHPAEHLLRLAADAALIVLGARGRGGFAGMLLGSVSQTVLHHADSPVAIIPATAGGR
ncbi:universal stress protein [Kribbella sp. NPDC026611]|uniref:universal stress protein n=1 Tax=Kribbella sp. NPDC026611 TaxID=3154911 RepID=UPI0033EEC205